MTYPSAILRIEFAVLEHRFRRLISYMYMVTVNGKWYTVTVTPIFVFGRYITVTSWLFLAHRYSLLGGGAGHAVGSINSAHGKGGGGGAVAPSSSTLLSPHPPLRLRPFWFSPSDSAPSAFTPVTPPPRFHPSDSAPSASTPPTRPSGGGGG